MLRGALYLSWVRQPKPHRVRRRIGAAACAELLEDRGDVVIDGALREHELLRDLGVPQPLCDESEHVELTGREAARVGTGRRARPARNPALTALAEPPRDQRVRRAGTELEQRIERSPERLRVVGVRAGERRLVRAAERFPELGGPRPVSREVNREWLRCDRRSGFLNAGTAAPERELACDPGGVSFLREREDGIADAGRDVAPPGERSHLGGGDGCGR